MQLLADAVNQVRSKELSRRGSFWKDEHHYRYDDAVPPSCLIFPKEAGASPPAGRPHTMPFGF